MRIAAATDEVPFPMSGNRSLVDNGRPVGDGHPILNRASFLQPGRCGFALAHYSVASQMLH